MKWGTLLPDVNLEDLTDVPKLKTATCFGCFSRNKLSDVETDLMVLTAFEGEELHGVFIGFDKLTKGRLGRALKRNKFSGKLGEEVLLDVRKLALKQQYIVVLGLGALLSYGSQAVCQTTRQAIDVATRVRAQKMTLPFLPQGLKDTPQRMQSFACTVNCRVEERSLRNKLGILREIQVVCTPEAQRWVESGFQTSTGPLCTSCPERRNCPQGK